MLFRCIPLFFLHLVNIQKSRNNSFFSNSSTKRSFTNIVANNYICLYIVLGASVAHLQNLTLSVWQCWSPRYNVSALSTCEGHHPSGLIVTSLLKSKRITTITKIIDLSNLCYLLLHNIYILV